MSEAVLVSVTALGQAEDGKYYVKKTEDKIYEITSDATVVVLSGVNAKFIDKVSSGKVTIYGQKDSVIFYSVLDSQSTERYFDIKGELNILEISISSTNETLVVDLTEENATCDVKNLSILTNVSSNYSQRINHMKKNHQSNKINIEFGQN